MHRLAHITMTAALAAAILAPSPPASAQQLSYSLPSPATATYHLGDTTTFSMASIGGAMDLGMRVALTYTLAFQAYSAGVVVSGELTDFSGVGDDPFGGGTSQIPRGESGIRDFVLTLGPRGVVEVGSSSVVAGSDLPMLTHPHVLFFPSLPNGELDAGGTWTDTVTTTLGPNGNMLVAYTYTVAGEETVDGRTYLRVDISGDGTMEMNDDMMTTTLTGEESGHFLWDAERSLMAVLELSRSFKGSAPGPGGTSMTMTFATTTRAALEN